MLILLNHKKPASPIAKTGIADGCGKNNGAAATKGY
jgi:hypothetical protein